MHTNFDTATFFAAASGPIEKHEPLPVKEEVALIEAAQAGDDDAKMRLLDQYAPVLRSTYFSFLRRLPQEEQPRIAEDTAAETLKAFFETLDEHNPKKSPRLAGRLGARLRKSLTDLSRFDTAFDVSESSLSRFYRVLRDYDGDVDAARAALVLDFEDRYHMSVENFNDVLAVVRDASSLTRVTEDRDDDSVAMTPITDDGRMPVAEAHAWARIALDAMNGEEREVVEHYYGFRDENVDTNLSDGEVAYRMSIEALGDERVSNGESVISRATVQRRRETALAVGRRALEVPLSEKDEKRLAKRDRA